MTNQLVGPERVETGVATNWTPELDRTCDMDISFFGDCRKDGSSDWYRVLGGFFEEQMARLVACHHQRPVQTTWLRTKVGDDSQAWRLDFRLTLTEATWDQNPWDLVEFRLSESKPVSDG